MSDDINQTAHMRDCMVNPPPQGTLPEVLLIGDSISIGYTLPVRRLLDGQAQVFRPPDNCAHSAYGRQLRWLLVPST